MADEEAAKVAEMAGVPDHYYPVMIVGSEGTHALVLSGDGSLIVDWAALRVYAEASPIDIIGITTANGPVDATCRCLAHAVLAMRDGRRESPDDDPRRLLAYGDSDGPWTTSKLIATPVEEFYRQLDAGLISLRWYPESLVAAAITA